MKFSFCKARLLSALILACLAGCSPQTIKETTLSVWRKQRGTEKKQAVPTRLEWRSRPEMPKAGLPALWSLKILDLRTDPMNLKGIRAYDAPHGVAMHLFVVARDGSQYAHFYPEPRDYGVFRVRPIIPQGGAYQLWVDFTPIDGYATIHSQKFLVASDEPFPPQVWAPSKTTSKATGSWLETKVQAREEQSFAPKAQAPFYIVQMPNLSWRAKQAYQFKVRVLSDKRVPVTDLQPHLGGAAYGLALSQDGERCVRLEAAPRVKGAIETTFRGTFPAPGLYRIFWEFRHADKIIIAPFVVRVTQAKKGATTK